VGPRRTIPIMWGQVPERLLSGVAISLEVVWLFCAAGIATWVLGVTGADVGPLADAGIVTLIWLVPIGVVVAFDVVDRRKRHGAPVPARHKGPVNPDPVHTSH